MLHRIALAAVASLLLLGGTAHASSLVYVKDHNVWSANPDGSNQRQLTADGLPALAYESPSQADDGTILAIRGEHFVKLDRQGNRIGVLPSILVGRPPHAYAVGPFSAKLSPDGTKLVYGIGTWSTWFDHGTNTSWSDPTEAVIWQDAVTGAQLGFTMFYEEATWLQDSTHTLLNNSGNRNAPQIGLATIGVNHNDVQHVFSDHDSKPAGEYYSMDVADPDLTPAGDRLAALRGTRAETLRFYDTRSGRPVVSACWLHSPTGGSFADPTWAPDGGALAWAEGDGIWSTPVGALDTGDCTWGAPRLIVPGGSQPDWGPAGGPPPPPPPPGPGGITVSAPGAIAREALVSKGVAVRVTSAQAGRAVAALARGQRVLRRKGRRVAAGGTTVIRLAPKRPDDVLGIRALRLRVRVGGASHALRLLVRD